MSVRKLLLEYFDKDQVKDALYDIGEPVSGNKNELASRLSRTWKNHNRNNYELLDFLEEDSLQMICHHYNLDTTPANENTYKRRIRNADLLNGNLRRKTKPIEKLTEKDEKSFRDVNINIGSIHLSKNNKISIVIGITGVVATVLGIIFSGL